MTWTVAYKQQTLTANRNQLIDRIYFLYAPAVRARPTSTFAEVTGDKCVVRRVAIYNKHGEVADTTHRKLKQLKRAYELKSLLI